MPALNNRSASMVEITVRSQNPIATSTRSATTKPMKSGDEMIFSRPGAAARASRSAWMMPPKSPLARLALASASRTFARDS